MGSDNQVLGLVMFIIFLFINFIMYGFSAAIQNINENEVERLADEKSKNAIKIMEIIDRPAKLINTIQLATTLMAMIVGYFELSVYGNILYNRLIDLSANYLSTNFIYIIAYCVTALYLAFIMLSLGILVPKRLGKKYPNQWAYTLLPINRFIMIVLTPVTFLISLLTNLVLKIFGIDSNDELDNVTEEEIKSMVNEGHEQGIIETSEAEMIANIFELGDKEAKDIMTNRKNVFAVNGDMTLAETVDEIVSGNYSRIPVYEGDLDNIIGVVNFRDVMVVNAEDAMEHIKIKDIPNLLRKPYFIPETRNIDLLFKDMQSNKIHLAVVIDEYGQTCGIISMEDVLEEIVGNILDEYDEEETNIVTSKDNVYLIKGMTTLEEIEETLEINFDEEDYDTLNGFLISKLGRIPSEWEKPEVVIEQYCYKILNVESKMISLVELTVSPKNEEAENQIDENIKN